MTKLTPQDYLQIIELIKVYNLDNQHHNDYYTDEESNQWDTIVEKLYEEINTLAYYSNHNLQEVK